MLCRKHQRTEAEVMNQNHFANPAYDYPAGPVSGTTSYDTLHKNEPTLIANNQCIEGADFYSHSQEEPTVADDERCGNIEEPPVTYKTFNEDQVYNDKLPSSDDDSYA